MILHEEWYICVEREKIIQVLICGVQRTYEPRGSETPWQLMDELLFVKFYTPNGVYLYSIEKGQFFSDKEMVRNRGECSINIAGIVTNMLEKADENYAAVSILTRELHPLCNVSTLREAVEHYSSSIPYRHPFTSP